MQALDDVILEPVEELMDKVGLMQGDMAPLKRTLLGAAIGGGICYAFHPRIAYNADKTPRKWTPFADAGDSNSTWVPWWMLVGVPAVILGVLI